MGWCRPEVAALKICGAFGAIVSRETILIKANGFIDLRKFEYEKKCFCAGVSNARWRIEGINT
jgi:hypothetical protein